MSLACGTNRPSGPKQKKSPQSWAQAPQKILASGNSGSPVDAAPVLSMPSSAETECICIICLESGPPPIQSGCACRSDSGLAHLDCLIEKAVAQQAHRGYDVWMMCQTCEQTFTGAMRTGFAEAWLSRVCDQAEESDERLCAAHNLAVSRRFEGKYADAERINREVLDVQRRVLGEEHPDTLRSADHLALSLMHQGKHADAERINREVLGAKRRVLGEEHSADDGDCEQSRRVAARAKKSMPRLSASSETCLAC
jgi:hypothetical protein